LTTKKTTYLPLNLKIPLIIIIIIIIIISIFYYFTKKREKGPPSLSAGIPPSNLSPHLTPSSTR